MAAHVRTPAVELETRGVVWLLALSVALACAAIVALVTSGSEQPAAASKPSIPARSSDPAVVATRWWSVPGAARGSRIDPITPGSVAATLTPSRADYCAVLKQTLSAGHSVVGDGDAADDPSRVLATEAFAAEVAALAPSEIGPQWHTLGTAMVALARSGGDLTTVKGMDPKALSAAATVVAKDAKTSCGVDLSSTTTTRVTG